SAGLPAREGRTRARPGDETASVRSGSDLACANRIYEGGRSLSRNSASEHIECENLSFSAKKHHRDCDGVFLSKPQAWYIITTQSWISSRAATRPCISSRDSVYFPAA
ncbi:MAG: hypothetical protein IKB35_00090, partial [Clostridia bacterium]|nr:hypothetical protein [Clostridia bacterium]